MKKRLLLICGLLGVMGLSVSAQKLKEGYVVFPQSTMLHNYVSQWNATNRAITVESKAWEDEEFFTSRVKPRTRVTQVGTNIYDFGDYAGRRSMWWVPVGSPDSQALPNGTFDSECFTMWSYIDHWGTWTTPFGWAVGAVADVAHKNGVAVSGVASVPNAGLSGDWSTSLSSLGSSYKSDATPLAKFLRYHGCDGLGYNSEFSTNSTVISNLYNMHHNLYKYFATTATANPIFENIWYDGTNESGSIAFDSALSGKLNIYKSSSVFSNYNWTTKLTTGQSNAEGVVGVDGSTKRGPWYNYAGFDQEGGQPKSTPNYKLLPTAKWSMGWWGSHRHNMFWQGRNAGGAGTLKMNQCYLKKNEQFWGNGPRNPAIKKDIYDTQSHHGNDNFFGVSHFINERSALTHTIATDPFYTYFNLGNGTFFNYNGERMHNNEWYSFGVQDFLPTWHFWFAPTWLQKDVTAGTVHLNANYTWEDAYFGGSCLAIEGSTTKEYLHLFKSAMKVANGQTITVRYKLLEGEADIRLVLTDATNPETEATEWSNCQLCTVATSPEVQDSSYIEGADGWVTRKFTIALNTANKFKSNTIGCIGLEFKNATNMRMLLGEISIAKTANMTTPAAPSVKSSKVLYNGFSGVDGKIFWTMDADAAWTAGTPKYNSDVNTSMFKVYSQEEGGTEQLVGVTTSWAAVVFQAPNTDNNKKIRFGVSAVAMDMKTESAISWGNYLAKGTYESSDEIYINKLSIKPGESFTIGYKDETHANSTWTIKNTAGVTVASATGKKIEVTNGLSELGGYDLIIDAGKTNERSFGYYVQITDASKGAVPEIHSMQINGTDVSQLSSMEVKLNEPQTLTYTGRSANGTASRALALNSRFIGCRASDLGLTASSTQSFSIAGWFYFDEIPPGEWCFMNASNRTGSYPASNWGWCWNNAQADGSLSCVFRKDGAAACQELHYDFGPTFRAKAWTHIAWICEYNNNSSSQFRMQLYVNGVKQTPTEVYNKTGAGGAKGTSWGADADGYHDKGTYNLTTSDYMYFGGAAYAGYAIDGYVDDFQIWGKAMTADEVKQSMLGMNRNSLPSGVYALWDFEENANDNNEFIGYGTKAGAKAYSYEIKVENGTGSYNTFTPLFASGCPFLSGTAYPVEVKSTWKDLNDRKTKFEKTDSRAAGDEGVSGTAKVTFVNAGAHNLQLTLSNDYGTAVSGDGEAGTDYTFPVITVPEVTAIDGIDNDGDAVLTTVEGNTVYFYFEGEGAYAIDAYNTAGMLAAQEHVNVVNGQIAQVTLGTPGVYVVKIVKDGKSVRTVKVVVK